MKYIVLLILGLTLPFSYTYADISTEIRISATELRLGERLTLDIEIRGTEISGEIQKDIAGLENFNIFSRSQQMQFQSINGEITSSVLMRLQLEPRESGVFTLGPSTITLGEERYIDETEVEIHVLSRSGVYQENQTHTQTSREAQETQAARDNRTPTSSERELYGIIEEDNTLIQALLRYGFYVLILVILSIILALILRYLSVSKKAITTTSDLSPREETSLFERYFGALDIRDDSHIFLKKYLKASEHYLTERSNSKQSYTPLTLDEMKQYKSFQTYALKADFETLYSVYYSGKILTDEDKKIYIENIKKYLNG